MRAGAVLLMLVVAPALAGCAMPQRTTCTGEFPLVLQAYPAVWNRSLMEFQVTLWNCTDRAIPLDEPCAGKQGILPRLVLDGRTYHVAHMTNFTAVLAEDVPCTVLDPERPASKPGDYYGQRYHWDGTYLPPEADAPVPVPPGNHTVSVKAGLYRRTAEVSVPWSAPT